MGAEPSLGGRFTLWITGTRSRKFSKRGTFVDYDYPPPSGGHYIRGKFVRVLRSPKGTIEVTYTPARVGRRHLGPRWTVTKGTGEYNGLRGSGRDWGAMRPPTPVYVVMAGEFRQ